jgi:hypothetical protein
VAKDGTDTGPEDTTGDVVWSSGDSGDNGHPVATSADAGNGRRRILRDRGKDRGGKAASTSTAEREVSTYAAIGDYGVTDTDAGQEPTEPEERFWIPKGKPFESLGQSARNHWQFVAACTLVGLLLGAAFGFMKTPNYTAESRLFVGKTAQLSNLASIPGLDAAGQSLAASYARLATTDDVLNATAKALGGKMDGTLSASPIPQAPIVLVEGTSTTTDGALAITKAGSKALVAAVDKLNEEQSKSADVLLKKYEDADLALVASQVQLQTVKNQLTQAQAAGSAPSVLTSLQQQVNAAQTEVDGNQVKVGALSAAYSGVFNPTAMNTQVLQVVGNPKATGSDRKSTLEIGLLAGLVAGCLVGLGIAALIDVRARRAA